MRRLRRIAPHERGHATDVDAKDLADAAEWFY